MDWKDIGAKISNAAPLLGGILGGPPGAAIGAGVKLLASLFGLKESETTPEVIDTILQQDPQALIKIKELEYQNQKELRGYYLESERMRLADVASARSREVEIVKSTGSKDKNLYTLAWTVIVGFFALCVVLMYRPLPPGQNEVVFMLFGGLATGFATVLQYFFGSSKGSADKTQIMTDATALKATRDSRREDREHDK